MQSSSSDLTLNVVASTPRQAFETWKTTVRPSGRTLVSADDSRVVVTCSLRSTISRARPRKMNSASVATFGESGASRRQSQARTPSHVAPSSSAATRIVRVVVRSTLPEPADADGVSQARPSVVGAHQVEESHARPVADPDQVDGQQRDR